MQTPSPAFLREPWHSARMPCFHQKNAMALDMRCTRAGRPEAEARPGMYRPSPPRTVAYLPAYSVIVYRIFPPKRAICRSDTGIPSIGSLFPLLFLFSTLLAPHYLSVVTYLWADQCFMNPRERRSLSRQGLVESRAWVGSGRVREVQGEGRDASFSSRSVRLSENGCACRRRRGLVLAHGSR